MKYRISKWLVSLANNLYSTPGRGYQRIDNTNYFDKEFLLSIEKAGFFENGLDHYFKMEEKVNEFIRQGHFVVSTPDGIETGDPMVIFDNLDINQDKNEG